MAVALIPLVFATYWTPMRWCGNTPAPPSQFVVAEAPIEGRRRDPSVLLYYTGDHVHEAWRVQRATRWDDITGGLPVPARLRRLPGSRYGLVDLTAPPGDVSVELMVGDPPSAKEEERQLSFGWTPLTEVVRIRVGPRPEEVGLTVPDAMEPGVLGVPAPTWMVALAVGAGGGIVGVAGIIAIRRRRRPVVAV